MAALIMAFVSIKKRLPGLLLLTGGLFYLIYIIRAI